MSSCFPAISLNSVVPRGYHPSSRWQGRQTHLAWPSSWNRLCHRLVFWSRGPGPGLVVISARVGVCLRFWQVVVIPLVPFAGLWPSADRGTVGRARCLPFAAVGRMRGSGRAVGG